MNKALIFQVCQKGVSTETMETCLDPPLLGDKKDDVNDEPLDTEFEWEKDIVSCSPICDSDSADHSITDDQSEKGANPVVPSKQ